MSYGDRYVRERPNWNPHSGTVFAATLHGLHLTFETIDGSTKIPDLKNCLTGGW